MELFTCRRLSYMHRTGDAGVKAVDSAQSMDGFLQILDRHAQKCFLHGTMYIVAVTRRDVPR